VRDHEYWPEEIPAACGLDTIGEFKRLAGSDRVDTAIAIARYRWRLGALRVVIARADDFADALGGGALAGSEGPVLLQPPRALDDRVRDAISDLLPPDGVVHIVGGPHAVDPSIEDALRRLGYRAVRHAGADGFETAVLVAQANPFKPNRIFVTTGTDFPDALSASAAAAAIGAVVLTDGTRMPESTDVYLDEADAPITVVGGAAAAALPDADAVVGADRYETSRLVALRFRRGRNVGLASGQTFADALGGAAAVAGHGVLLLTEPDTSPMTPSDA
jgi:putative cell wall-binding protein